MAMKPSQGVHQVSGLQTVDRWGSARCASGPALPPSGHVLSSSRRRAADSSGRRRLRLR